MKLRVRALAMALLGAAAGCAVSPPAEQPAAPEIAVPAPRAPLADEAERVLRERAEAHEQQRRWADALLQWEMLLLLKPEIADYHERAGTTRLRIRAIAEKSLALAEQARRSGNLDRAMQEYLRVLSVDRDNARAAQGLRDIERERTRRNYLNRPPRIVM